jgi:hypothetical protein
MPVLWKVTMAILVAALLASVVIGTVRLITTPTETLGDVSWGGHNWHLPGGQR